MLERSLREKTEAVVNELYLIIKNKSVDQQLLIKLGSGCKAVGALKLCVTEQAEENHQ